MLCIFLAEESLGCRYIPINAKTIVKDRDTSICFGMVELVTLILEYGSLAQYCKAMSKATRDEELAMDSRCYLIAR